LEEVLWKKACGRRPVEEGMEKKGCGKTTIKGG